MAENRLTKFWPGLDDREPQATYRAQMLPYAEYDDGSYRFGTPCPRIVPDTWEAIQKMGRAAQSAFGANYAPEDVMPTAQDAGLIAGLAMTGAGGFGAFGKAVSGKAPAQVEASRLLPSHGVEAGSGPLTARVYRGTTHPNDQQPNVFWASDDPSVAQEYARHQSSPYAAITPADMTFQNPMIVEGQGMDWNM